MANAMDVADYTICQAAKLGKPLSNLHLQKTLYFLNVIHLLQYNKPLISDVHFERWHYGPVLADVYSEYSDNGSNFIDEPKSHDYMYFDQEGQIQIEEHNFNLDDIIAEDQQFIKDNISYFDDMSPFELVNYSHRETQWKDQPLSASYDDNRTIKFYSNPENRFWEK